MRRAATYRWVLMVLLAVPVWSLFAQTSALRDTTASRDSSVVLDTSAVVSPSGIDTLVTYQATDSVVYLIDSRLMSMFGKSSITYRELGLKSEVIDIDWNTTTLHARGVVDSTDSSQVRYKGLPELIDGSEKYNGSDVTYNFRSKKGRIDLGKTEIEKGFYTGEAIKRVASDVLFVESGKYTTCDLEHPHFYVACPEMKVIVRDKIIARPVYLYIADVPVFALPFGVFPSERGRRSGIIAPSYGESTRGRYLLHLGYYWAMNDYMDLNVRADGYTGGSYTIYSDYRYALRYNFTGGISGSYARVLNGEEGDPGFSEDRLFNIRLNHSQEFNPSTRLLVDMTFTSGSYYQQTSNDLNDLLRQNVVSNATLTKFWEGTPNSMTINVRRDQNLQPTIGGVELSELLPGIAFSRSQSFPFRSSKGSGTGDQWYELIGYTYTGQFLRNRTTTLLADGKDTDDRLGVQHQVSVNASPKLGYFTVTPFLNYTEKWYTQSIRRALDPVDSVVTEEDVSGFNAVRMYDMGVALSTKFFGIFQPGIFGIRGIRHQVTPSIAYTYAPDYTQASYGYYGTYEDQQGITQRYGYYDREVFGGAPGEGQQALSFRIGNVLEMKTAVDDTSQRENKFTLLNLDISSGYNFKRDSLKFDEISIGFRTSVGQYLNIGGSTRYNLYKFEQDPLNPYGGRRVNKFLVKEEGRLADMTSFSISVGTRFSGEKTETTAGPERTAEDSLKQRGERSGYVSLYDQQTPDFSIPWNLDLNWNFNQSSPGSPSAMYRSSTISAALGFNLTKLWKITAAGSYDLLRKEVAAPQITVYRDLHCWELNFVWVPTGQYRNFRVEIRLKANQLQDVKVTKQSSLRGNF